MQVSNYRLFLECREKSATSVPLCKAMTDRNAATKATIAFGWGTCDGVRRKRLFPYWWDLLTYQYISRESNHCASCRTIPCVNPRQFTPVRMTWIDSFISKCPAHIHLWSSDFGARVRAVNSKRPQRIGIKEAENTCTRPFSSFRISVRRVGMACQRPVELYLSQIFVHICVSIPRLSNTSKLRFNLAFFQSSYSYGTTTSTVRVQGWHRFTWWLVPISVALSLPLSFIAFPTIKLNCRIWIWLHENNDRFITVTILEFREIP